MVINMLCRKTAALVNVQKADTALVLLPCVTGHHENKAIEKTLQFLYKNKESLILISLN